MPTRLVALAPSAHVEVKVQTLAGTDAVAYLWSCGYQEAWHEHTIGCLVVFHDCDQHLTASTGEDLAAFSGWQMTGVGAHDLINSDPLHIEASVYWPDCCGLHGFIRDGRWTPA